MIAFREHFYCVNEAPHLSCIVHYQDAVVPQAVLDQARFVAARAQPAPTGPTDRNFRRRDGAPDPCEGLDENERALFNHLREWRAKVAHDERLPPFLVLTNRQLLAIVRKRPDSVTALRHIDRIGPGKVERYGAGILKALHGMPREAAAPRADLSGCQDSQGRPGSDFRGHTPSMPPGHHTSTPGGVARSAQRPSRRRGQGRTCPNSWMASAAERGARAHARQPRTSSAVR